MKIISVPENDFVEIRNHLEGLANDEEERDCQKQEPEFVFLPLLLEVAGRLSRRRLRRVGVAMTVDSVQDLKACWKLRRTK